MENKEHVDMSKDNSNELWAKTLITMTASMAMAAKIAKHRSDLVAELNRHPTIQDNIQESIRSCDIVLKMAVKFSKDLIEECADLMNQEEIVDLQAQKLYDLVK